MSNSSARIKDSHFFIVLLVCVLLYEIHVFLEKIVSEILSHADSFFTCCSFKLWPNVWNSWVYQKLLLQWSLQHWRKKGLLPLQLLSLRWKVRNSIDHFLFLYNQLVMHGRIVHKYAFVISVSLGFFILFVAVWKFLCSC